MTKESTIQPFEKGDVFVGVTLLNNPDDDHAGDGRIIQYDADLNEKGVLWVEGTSHLVGGLTFGPDGNLWAFDSHAYAVLRITPEGKQLPSIDFGSRSFSHVNFLADGTLLMGEHLVGNEVKLPPDRPLGTTLPFMPGTERFGDGHVFKFTMEGELLKEYATETHGGMPGFLGCTSSQVHPDGKTLIYCSEISPRVCRYDLENDKQLDDLITYAPDSGNMAMTMKYLPDGTLLYLKANFREGFFMQSLDNEGNDIRTWNLPGPGWANIGPSIESGVVFLGNFFTGAVMKMDLESGNPLAQAETGSQRSLAGVAQYPG
ncbi:MAG: WD40 repeat domain-containing protein [Gammaproteobacteria bacterium]|nr:WD40 repeat domain-containing protein [Gammaproteobacteria bacterium]